MSAVPPNTTSHSATGAPAPPRTTWSRSVFPPTQLDVISYGKEKPVCEDHDEACWQRNRRIHIVAMAQSH